MRLLEKEESPPPKPDNLSLTPSDGRGDSLPQVVYGPPYSCHGNKIFFKTSEAINDVDKYLIFQLRVMKDTLLSQPPFKTFKTFL